MEYLHKKRAKSQKYMQYLIKCSASLANVMQMMNI